MKKTGIFLYAVTGALAVFYLAVSLIPNVIIEPSVRLFLLVLPCVTVYTGSLLMIRGKDTEYKKKIMGRTFGVIFAFYLLLISALVLFDSYYGRTGHMGIWQWNKELFANYVNTSCNLIPFATIWEYISVAVNGTMNADIILTNLAGNIVAFCPFGFFLPLLWKRQKGFGWFALTVTVIVAAVELLQFAMLVGSCDIDDLILNVLGALAVFALTHIPPIKKLIEKITFLEY